MDLLAIPWIAWACSATAILTYALGTVAANTKVKVRKEWRWAKEEKPRLGGVAMLIAIVVLFLILTGGISRTLLASLGITVVGIIDDYLPLPVVPKLSLQILGAAIVPWCGITFNVFMNPFLDVILTTLWILLVTNALNILDNIDGLAAGAAAISLLLFCFYGGEFEYSLLIVSACVGFLLLNWHPAKIFLGDAGSHLLGVSIAIQGVILANNTVHKTPTLFLLIGGCGVALFDFLFVIWTRIRSGRSPWQAGKDHSSHRLVNLGISTRLSVTILIMAHICMSVVGALLFHSGLLLQMILLSATGVVLSLGYRRLKSAPTDFS